MSYIIDVNMPKSIAIGKQGENNVETFIIDYSKWFADYGDGTVDVLIQRPKDTAPYLLPTTKIDDTRCCSFTITSVELQQVGKAEIQIRYTVEDKIKKSSVFNVYIAESLDDEIDAPSEWQTYIDYITELEQKAVAAGENAPKIIDDYWYVYNTRRKAYVNTNVRAKGVDGANSILWKQELTSGRKIAEIEINGVVQEVFESSKEGGAIYEETTSYSGTKMVSQVTKDTWSDSPLIISIPKGTFFISVLARLTSGTNDLSRGVIKVNGVDKNSTLNYFNGSKITRFSGVVCNTQNSNVSVVLSAIHPTVTCNLEIHRADAIKIGDVV